MKPKTEMTIMNRLKGRKLGDVELHLEIYKAYFECEALYHKLRRLKERKDLTWN